MLVHASCLHLPLHVHVHAAMSGLGSNSYPGRSMLSLVIPVNLVPLRYRFWVKTSRSHCHMGVWAQVWPELFSPWIPVATMVRSARLISPDDERILKTIDFTAETIQNCGINHGETKK